MRTKRNLIAAVACGVAAVAGARGAMATADSAPVASGHRLVGTWSVSLSRPGQPPLASLQAYAGTGSMLESGNDTASRSPQYGSWKRTASREYTATGVFFRFDPKTGAFVGNAKINRTIRVSRDGRSFTFTGRATVYDANGQVAVSFPVSGSGSRLEVEAQP